MEQPFGFPLFKVGPSPFPNHTHQRTQKWDKNPSKGIPLTRDTSDGDENKTWDKIQISFGKKKGQILQNIKSNLLELERLVITNTVFSKWQGAFHLHMNCAGEESIKGQTFPSKSQNSIYSQKSIYMNIG